MNTPVIYDLFNLLKCTFSGKFKFMGVKCMKLFLNLHFSLNLQRAHMGMAVDFHLGTVGKQDSAEVAAYEALR